MTAIPTGMQRAMLVASALALAVPAAGPAGAERTADPAAAAPSGNVTVDVLTVNGSGCPAGTARVTPAPDNTGFRVAYSRYAAEVGPGADPTELRKNCQLSLLVRVPQGFTYAIARADYSGIAHLAGGATGLQRANYYFQGSSDDNFSDHWFRGPLDGRWHTTDVTAAAELVYAPCGAERILNVNTELRVDAGTSDAGRTASSLAMTSTNGSVNTVYHFGWKQCP